MQKEAVINDAICVLGCLTYSHGTVSGQHLVALLILVDQRVLTAATADHRRHLLLVVAAALSRRDRIPLGCAVSIFPHDETRSIVATRESS
jgi:hypothetical protein